MRRPESPLATLYRSDAYQRLSLLRWFSVLAQLLLPGLASRLGQGPLPYWPLFALTAGLVLANALTHWRRRRAGAVKPLELAAQHAVDVLQWTVWLYWLGGATNPLVSVLLLPLLLAAINLPLAWVVALTGFTLLSYSSLMFWFQPWPPHVHHDPEQAFWLHTMGMWLTFSISALLSAWFVASAMHRLRQREQELRDLREARLRQEQLVGLAVQAAGAAHQMGTPLSTLTLLLDEALSDAAGPSRDDLLLMRQQVELCRQSLSRLKASGEASAPPRPASQVLAELLENWRLLRPRCLPGWRVLGSDPEPLLRGEASLQQALLSLLDNAADASPDAVEVELDWPLESGKNGPIRLSILDRGPGFSEQPGTLFVSSKGDDGHGVGVWLARASIERLGGSLRFSPRAGGGAHCQITLPGESRT